MVLRKNSKNNRINVSPILNLNTKIKTLGWVLPDPEQRFSWGFSPNREIETALSVEWQKLRRRDSVPFTLVWTGNEMGAPFTSPKPLVVQTFYEDKPPTSNVVSRNTSGRKTRKSTSLSPRNTEMRDCWGSVKSFDCAVRSQLRILSKKSTG
ncbi:hypothetical protein NPIL_102081 [Nephila pilipes]|uniref:Uncharacterized protein n=1 Tax=Nephila pilipes TaxID=299642 RepID=A0A8X6UF84_NEPPI|nr:hypothetical protein NPIL_102081 [Nephila pilipes]